MNVCLIKQAKTQTKYFKKKDKRGKFQVNTIKYIYQVFNTFKMFHLKHTSL